MSFNWNFSLGDIIALAVFVFGFWRAQVSSMNAQQKMHLDGIERINRLETSLVERMARLETWKEFVMLGGRRKSDISEA